MTLSDQLDRELIRKALDDTLVVEAAAGTGKTTELVARIVRLIATGRATIDQIVAVTFTEKAAGELKLRIREELEKARAEKGTVPFFDAALAHLEEAHVSTIHGFCADLLRERPVEAGVDPGFDVLTEPQANRLFDRAFRDWFQRQLEAPSEGVRRALRRLPSAWSPYADDEDGPVERLRRAGLELLQWRDLRAPWRRDGFDRDGETRRLVNDLCALADLTEQPSWDKDPLYAATAHLRLLAGDFRRAREDGGEDDLDGWEAILVRLVASAEFKDIQKRTGKKPDYGAGVTRAHVLAAYASLAESLAVFARRADADLAALLQHELLECVDLYDRMKSRAGALDFLDLLLEARDLVRDCAHVRRAFQRRFKYILVDEFQDTDPLQAEILLLLAAGEDSEEPGDARQEGTPSVAPGAAALTCRPPVARATRSDAGGDAVRPNHGSTPAAGSPKPDWRRLPVRAGALFVVGDPKQSIYRFRRADVGVYQEVCDLLVDSNGARRVHLNTNFRSVPDIQHAVNTAFAPAMTRDDLSLQADYVPLAPFREPLQLPSNGGAEGVPSDSRGATRGAEARIQPAVVALPVPDPYGRRYVAMGPIEESLPDAVGAWVDWLVNKSGWTVAERREGNTARVAIEPRHVCILFRRFVKFGSDLTRSYVDALEARGIPHLLVGGRSFHDREEVETLRAALAAIEWPDDALSVYATLRGALFALGEEALLEYWHAHKNHRFHPFDVPDNLPPRLQPVGEALTFLRELHARRNFRPAAETIGRLLEHTRAHVTFVMRPAGERVLANVLQVVELARQYEADDGISFRGFVDALREAAERAESPEAPVVEEGSDGVRLMTVHKAKGLEFPVVILADITCKLNRNDAVRYIDQVRGLCAMKLLGCAPADLLDREAEEVARDAAEGVRLAYVAATRARDVLVVPAIGDGEYDGWISTLNGAIYPPASKRRDAQPAPGCPPFGMDSVRTRPDGDPARGDTVRPGLHQLASDTRFVQQVPYPVVWWDPHALGLGAEPPFGLRREDLIAKAVDDDVVAAGRAKYDTWALDRTAAADTGSQPSLLVRTITELAHAGVEPAGLGSLPPVEVVIVAREGSRPGGRRFGTLVHAVLATTPLDADVQKLHALATLEARILAAPEEEATAAAALAARVLAHPLLHEARTAHARGRCRREVPVTLTLDGGRLLEGVVDLAYEQAGTWRVVDFKTDDDPSRAIEAYRRQVGLYAAAIARVSEQPAQGIICAV